MKYLPSKHAVVAGLIVFALGMYIYNKYPTVRTKLGAAA